MYGLERNLELTIALTLLRSRSCMMQLGGRYTIYRHYSADFVRGTFSVVEDDIVELRGGMPGRSSSVVA